MQLCAGPPSSEGERGGAYHLQAARLPQDTMCVRPALADLIDNHQIRGVCGCAIQVQVTTMKIPFRATSSAQKGERPILEYTTSGAAPTSPSDIRSICEQSGSTTGRLGSTGLRDMPSEGRHSTHSGIYLLLLSPPGLDTISDDNGPAGSSRRMDLATAAGARATRMSLLWAGWSSWRTRAGATPTTRPPGARRRVSLEHGSRRRTVDEGVTWHVQGYCFD
jgi:hypothetical protein